MNKINRYKEFINIIETLQRNDKNGSWIDIIEELNGRYIELIKYTIEALETAIENAEDYDDKCFYKVYKDRLEKLL